MSSETIKINVDLRNPGQFLACCGLLELAGRLDPEATGRFERDTFILTGCKKNILSTFLEAEIVADEDDCTKATRADEEDEDRSPPVLIRGGFDLRLDWWTDSTAARAGFKTWSGGQTVLGFLNGMRQKVAEMPQGWPNALTHTALMRQPKPFYFDSRLSRLTSLDAGFSTEKFTLVFSPAVELLAFVGLQRFRPVTVIPRERYVYFAWHHPLPVTIAAAAAYGLMPLISKLRYEFPLVVRTGGKYKAFGTAILDRRNHA